MPIQRLKPHLFVGCLVSNLFMLAKASILRIASPPFRGQILSLVSVFVVQYWSAAFVSCRQRPIPQRFCFCWPVIHHFNWLRPLSPQSKQVFVAGTLYYWAGVGSADGRPQSHPKGSLQAFRELRLMVASIVSSAAGPSWKATRAISLFVAVSSLSPF